MVVASAFAVADLLVGRGHRGEAERTYQDALQLASQHGPEAEHITAHHHLGLSMIYRQRGDDTLAADQLNQAAELGLQTTLVDWLYRWNVAQAQLKEAAGDLETALALLEIATPLVTALLARLLQAAEAQKRWGSALDILLVQALAHEAQGNHPQALAAQERALALAEPEGYVR